MLIKSPTFLKLATCLVLALPAYGMAAEGRWTEGFGQGDLEYFIDKQGMRLHIACPTEEGSANAFSAVTLQRQSDSSAVDPFTITVNGITVTGPVEADSRVGTDNFQVVFEGVRKGDAVVKFGKKTVVFPKANAPSVLPKPANGTRCNLM